MSRGARDCRYELNFCQNTGLIFIMKTYNTSVLLTASFSFHILDQHHMNQSVLRFFHQPTRWWLVHFQWHWLHSYRNHRYICDITWKWSFKLLNVHMSLISYLPCPNSILNIFVLWLFQVYYFKMVCCPLFHHRCTLTLLFCSAFKWTFAKH